MTELTVIIDKYDSDYIFVGVEKIIFKNAVLVSTDDMEARIEFKALPTSDGTIYEVENG
jgi:hypothetical protein